MKGIILAGGSGTRLHPTTIATSKQLLPIFDKPMIYYPLSVLMLADIRDILIICNKEDLESFKKLLGKGKQFGINLTYKIQEKPEGIGQAFLIGEEFIGDDKVCLVLGDNIFYGPKFSEKLLNATQNNGKATIFGYPVPDPQRFGIVEIDNKGNALSIEEKPIAPKSNYAVTGLYFYDNRVCKFAKEISPSERGELEITDINNMYLNHNDLCVEVLERGFAWLDSGTNESLLEASQFVKTIQSRQGLMIACLEEIAFRNHWIDLDQLYQIGNKVSKTAYGQYILRICNTIN